MFILSQVLSCLNSLTVDKIMTK